MTAWLLEEELDVQLPSARGDDDWEKEAWETDEEPDWADDDDDDDDDDWDDDDEDDEGYDIDEDEDDD